MKKSHAPEVTVDCDSSEVVTEWDTLIERRKDDGADFFRGNGRNYTRKWQEPDEGVADGEKGVE